MDISADGCVLGPHSDDGLEWGGKVVLYTFLISAIGVAYLNWTTGAMTPIQLILTLMGSFFFAFAVGLLVALGRVLFRLLAKAITALLIPYLTRE